MLVLTNLIIKNYGSDVNGLVAIANQIVNIKESNVIFGGRLGHYKYYDMDKVIITAIELVECEK